jgi:SAM-dependent methyltransferase
MEQSTSRIEARFVAVSRSRTFRNLLDTYGLSSKAVLDIGCSYGEHLAHFGPGSTGLTIEPEEAAEGQRRGLDIRFANIEMGLPFEKTYDAIYCSNLLEHLYSPHSFLHMLRGVVKPNSILILGVPVLPFPLILTRIRKFRGALATQHINFFVKATLALTV